MTLNELLAKQNVFTKISIKDGDKELPKELKIKVMRIRMAYAKAKKAFDSETQEFINELITDEFRDLSSKSERTVEEDTKFKELTDKVNSDYQEFLIQKGREEVNSVDDTFSMEEYSEIIEVNAGNDVEINGTTIPAVDFLEIIYDLFVKED